MNDTHTHDHSEATHSADCDSCDYVAKTHAHDADEAVSNLAIDLAAHNKEMHNAETKATDIKDAVKGKMQTL